MILDRKSADRVQRVQRVAEKIGVDYDTAYAMMLITATLMDMHPDDAAVAEMILSDRAQAEAW